MKLESESTVKLSETVAKTLNFKIEKTKTKNGFLKLKSESKSSKK